MAAVTNNGGANGTYGAQQGYGNADGQQPQHNGVYNNTNPQFSQNAQPAASAVTSTGGQVSDIPKDEVGWYFVEQYYTTLSRNPEKLYLFYNKRSQFVSGQETDKVSVCVGQRAINDKIKELDFQECKVRVTNVDSQASDSNIVIQVIGEISNKSQPQKKFAQTFVLATQTNGYFVLNDIFRYLLEEDDEDDAEPEPEEHEEIQQAAAVDDDATEQATHASSIQQAEPEPSTGPAEPKAAHIDAQAVDQALEEKVLNKETAEGSVLEASNDINASEDVAVSAENKDDGKVEQTENSVALAVEKPKEPEPTPKSSPPKQAAQPAAAPKSTAPKTWANLAAAANRVATPVQPTSQARAANPTTTAAAKASPAQPAPTTQNNAGPAAPVATPAARDQSPSSVTQQDEWTAVGGSHARQQSRQTNSQQQEAPQHRAYIKNVFEGVDGKELKSHLEKFGEIAYFDVARQKNCAFVDFKTADGYNAAVAANPHVLGSERLFVEERRVRPAGSFGPQRGQFQGGRGGRGAANQASSRGNFQGTRGGAQPQARGGRGGAPAARGGRGASQAA